MSALPTQRLLPQLLLVCLVFLMKDIFLEKYSFAPKGQVSANTNSQKSDIPNPDENINLTHEKDKYVNTQKEIPNSELDDFEFDAGAHAPNAETEPNQSVDFDIIDEDEDDEYIPATKKTSPSKLGKTIHVRFQICTSCGYKNMVGKYQQMLAARYGPTVTLGIESYPVESHFQMIAQAVSLIKFFLMYVAFSQFNPFVAFGFMTEADPVPEFLQKMKDNKMYSCLMIFFLANAIESSLISTGAFEIYVGDELIASKLETGNVPQPNVVLEKIDLIMGKAPGSAGFGF